MKENLTYLIAIPVFLFFVVLEYLAMRKKDPDYTRLNDGITNLNIGVVHVLSKVLVGIFLIWVYGLVYDNIRILTIPKGVFSFIFCLIAYDFFFYWAHRFGHEINLFWGAHGVHHQSEDYNLTVALRQSWFHAVMAFFIFLPIPFLGVDSKTFFSVLTINSFYQFWIHTHLINRMPRWFEFVFNSPAHHRVHHGRNPKYIDKNHAGMFIIWDKLFGTFQEEEETPDYGITKPLNSWNPAWANIEYFSSMIQNARRFNFKDKLKYIFAKPGWQPDYAGGTIAVNEVNSDYKKYDAQNSKGLNIYVVVQFLIIIIGLVAYLQYYKQWSFFYQSINFILIVLSTVICGAILENKSWVKYAEFIRITIILIDLNSLFYFNYDEFFEWCLLISIIAGVYFIVWYALNINRIHLFRTLK